MRNSKWAVPVYDVLLRKGPLRMFEIARELGIDKRQAERALETLQRQGLTTPILRHSRVCYSAENTDMEISRSLERLEGLLPITGAHMKIFLPVNLHEIVEAKIRNTSDWDREYSHPLGRVASLFSEGYRALRDYLYQELLSETLETDPDFSSKWRELNENEDYLLFLESRGSVKGEQGGPRNDSEILKELERKTRSLNPEVLGAAGTNIPDKVRNYGQSLSSDKLQRTSFYWRLGNSLREIPLTKRERMTLTNLEKIRRYCEGVLEKDWASIYILYNWSLRLHDLRTELEMQFREQNLKREALNVVVRSFLRKLESGPNELVSRRLGGDMGYIFANYGPAVELICRKLRMGEYESNLLQVWKKSSDDRVDGRALTRLIFRLIEGRRQDLDPHIRNWFEKAKKRLEIFVSPDAIQKETSAR